MTRLSGMLGTSQATDSVGTLRDTVTRLDPPDGSARLRHRARRHHRRRVHARSTGRCWASPPRPSALILLLLLIVYRSPVGAAIPLISVGLALAVARPIVAALGDAGLAEVSLFSVALLAAMMLGAGTDYAIFLIGRYHEGRRRGVPSADGTGRRLPRCRTGHRGFGAHDRGGAGHAELRRCRDVPQHRNPLRGRCSGGDAGRR